MLKLSILSAMLFGLIGGSQQLRQSANLIDLGSNVFTLILIFIIEIVVIRYCYNYIAPKMILNFGGDLKNYQPVGYYDAVVLSVLFNVLFN
jgi:hypothetical protein